MYVLKYSNFEYYLLAGVTWCCPGWFKWGFRKCWNVSLFKWLPVVCWDSQTLHDCVNSKMLEMNFRTILSAPSGMGHSEWCTASLSKACLVRTRLLPTESLSSLFKFNVAKWAWVKIKMTFCILVTISVTRLGYFWCALVTNIVIKVAQIFDYFSKCHH